MGEIQRGKINTLEEPLDRNGDFTRARILPDIKNQEPTRPLVIPWWLRGEMGKLKIEDEVVFTVFEDLTGFIVGRCDGEWWGIVPGTVTVTEWAVCEDLQSSEIPSYNKHIHRDVVSGPGESGIPKHEPVSEREGGTVVGDG